VPLSQNASQRRRRRLLPSKHHTRSACLSIYPNPSVLTSNLQDCVMGSALYCTFLCGFGTCGVMYSCPVSLHSIIPSIPIHASRQDYRRPMRARVTPLDDPSTLATLGSAAQKLRCLTSSLAVARVQS
jgi:hypothetical protein